MVRQAHTYLAGAVSGSALIAAAVVAFVLLVSLQALKDWPLAGIGGGGDSAGVSSGKPLSPPSQAVPASIAAPGVAAIARGEGNHRARRQAAAAGQQQVGDAVLGTNAPSAASPASPVPAATTAPAAGGDQAGTAPAPATSASNASGGAGGGSGAGAGTSQPGGGSKGAGSGSSTSGAVTGAVNNTVSGVDNVTGGTLGNVGVPQVTEEVVNGVAGPETTIGKTVDKVAETVGGLLGGHH